MRNFKSYGPYTQTIDFTNVNAVGIGGKNGAGKSSLIEALTFALYGKATATEIRELGDEALINDRANEAYVSISFEKDDTTYTVERTIGRKGAAKARLTSSVLTEAVVDVRAVNEKAKSILGMDYETFVSSAIIRQEEMDRLTARPPAERKEMLAKIFGLQAYESMRERAHEKAWEIRIKITQLDATKKALEDRISYEEATRKKLSEHEARIAELESKRTQIIAEKTEIEEKVIKARETKIEFDTKDIEKRTLVEQSRNDENGSENLRKQIQEAEEASKELHKLKGRLKDRKEVSMELQKLVEQREQLKVAKAEWQQKKQVIEQKTSDESENHQRIRDYTVPECPICKRPLDEPHRTQILKKYEQSLSKLRRARDQAAQNVDDAQKVLSDKIDPAIENIQMDLDELNELERKTGELATAASRLPRLRKELERVEAQTAEKKKRIGELELALRKLAPTIESFAALDGQRRELENELIAVEGDVGREKANRNRENEILSEVEQAKTKLQEILVQIDDKGHVRWAYEFLEREVFHKKGVPTNILMEIVPDIENEACKILKELSNGRMDVGFRFGRKTKTGRVTEELIVEVVEHGRSQPLSRYSGGERMRINLALRLGISEVVARRSGYKGRIETMVIDEGFGPLDEDGRRATVEILQALRARFKKILVVSHIDEVREAFETRLTVTKPLGGHSSVNVL